MLIILTFATESDRLKFERLFDKYKRLLLHRAYGILNDYALAEDAVSEAYIRIYKNLGKIEEVDSPKTVSFIVTIVKNVSLTILEKRKNVYLTDMSEDEGDGYNIEEAILSNTVTGDMLKLVDELREELRVPFLLKYAHDLSHREIALILHISENNVTVRIHRAKKKLAELFVEAGYSYEK